MSDVAKRDAHASFFHSRGYCPLPSQFTADRKKPLVLFKHLREGPALDLAEFARFPSSDLQVLTGRYWELLVIDLDGAAAVEHWQRMPQSKPRTWVTCSGGGGEHWWFRVPKTYPHKLPKAVLWEGSGKHEAIERLCDGSLIAAPPSIHPVTGNRYRFLDSWHSPSKIPRPADCPGWLLQMSPIRAAKSVIPMPAPVVRTAEVPSGRYRASDVRAAIPDLIGLCASWGIRFVGSERDGWCECHAIDREDRKPSAAVNRLTGHYRDLGGAGTSLGFFELAAEVGGLGQSWRDAVAILGDQFRAREAG